MAHFISERFVVCRTADKYNTLNIICSQPGFLHCFPRCVNSLRYQFSNKIIQLAPRNININVYFFSIQIHAPCFAFTKSNGAFFSGGQFNFSFFRRPLCKTDQHFILLICKKIIRKIKMGTKPRINDVVKNNSVPVSTAAHFNSSMCQQVNFPSNILRNRDIKSSAAQIIDQENALCFRLTHYAHYSCNWLLHQRDIFKSRQMSSLHGGVFLHLVECCRNCNNNCSFLVVPNFLWKISIQDF